MTTHHIRNISLVISLFCFSSFAIAADWDPLVDTGQTTCYDNAGVPIDCPASGESLYGQDANYVGPEAYYQTNGDGTITDMRTNLMWQQAQGTYMNWEAAKTYCNELTLAGYQWRLPSRRELKSIIDYSKSNPAADHRFYFTYHTGNHWTSTPDAYNSSQAWIVDFTPSGTTAADNYLSINSTNYVRCVRDVY